METVYLETTFISYLVSKPSNDTLVAGYQELTARWWATCRNRYTCFSSQVVIDEASAGDSHEVSKRLKIIQQLGYLETDVRAEDLTLRFMNSGILPQKAFTDASHVAVAAVHGMEYLLTWNCKHLANSHISSQLEKICTQVGFRIPRICTPKLLLRE